MLDVSLYGASIPAGTYTKGDMVELKNIDGPSVVRSGRGAAILKRITSGTLIGVAAGGANSYWAIHVVNSDWIDPAISLTSPLDAPTALDLQNGSIQDGQGCPLTPNSSWKVYAIATATITTTIANSVYCTIDVDYPAVSSIVDPKTLVGIPTTLELDTTTDAAAPNIETAAWKSINTDMFKAGYEYALVKPEIKASTGAVGFIKLSDAAGMSGLVRIIPIAGSSQNVRNNIEYASKLVKGPMTVSLMMFSTSGTAVTGAAMELYLDFVKRRV